MYDLYQKIKNFIKEKMYDIFHLVCTLAVYFINIKLFLPNLDLYFSIVLNQMSSTKDTKKIKNKEWSIEVYFKVTNVIILGVTIRPLTGC